MINENKTPNQQMYETQQRLKDSYRWEEENAVMRKALQDIVDGCIETIPEDYRKEPVCAYAYAYECLRLHANTILNRLGRRWKK